MRRKIVKPVFVTGDFHKRLKLFTVERELKMGDFVEGVLNDYLDKHQ